MEKNIQESKRVGKIIRAIHKLCYRNAFRVVQNVPGYEKANSVEGIASFQNGLPIEHGWVERNGEIIDPTLPEKKMTYFPGLTFKGQQGIAEALLIPKAFKTDPDVPFSSDSVLAAATALAFARRGTQLGGIL